MGVSSRGGRKAWAARYDFRLRGGLRYLPVFQAFPEEEPRRASARHRFLVLGGELQPLLLGIVQPVDGHGAQLGLLGSLGGALLVENRVRKLGVKKLNLLLKYF